MRIEVVRAWPHRYQRRLLDLREGATAGEAVAASGIAADGVAGIAVFGERVEPARVLCGGERVELLGPLLADPKEARRRRAQRAEAPAKPEGAGRSGRSSGSGGSGSDPAA